MKTGCTSKISQISGFLKHIPKNFNCLFISLRANSKNPFCLEEAEKLFLAALANMLASQLPHRRKDFGDQKFV